MKTFNGGWCTLDVEPFTTVEELKVEIEDKVGVRPSQVDQFWEGCLLLGPRQIPIGGNKRTLADYNIGPESSLNLIAWVRADMFHKTRGRHGFGLDLVVQRDDTEEEINNKEDENQQVKAADGVVPVQPADDDDALQDIRNTFEMIKDAFNVLEAKNSQLQGENNKLKAENKKLKAENKQLQGQLNAAKQQ
ncbi:unnamed protein product [Vitrella brassicaformis CCMP3155]|uniref:Ubiquitin-like domain-containing protein n=2 Tax=Vitrella brassicaformis TaxID=1169539 RepID=A0A0G4FT15_VITBC|nr:unnamed protein product [Vitrella brassicaformis CCMP3155]|eukprot:CEM17820.1 unnamed protein product [Vitrella brassicaformis CCMP3155]